jgi:dienelactone hydrolase
MKLRWRPPLRVAFVSFALAQLASGAERNAATPDRADQLLTKYFESATASLKDRCLSEVNSIDDWNRNREQYRRQLLEMLSLDPLPRRTGLNPVVTGKVEQPNFSVENLHFQSQPGLYVTANLYLPKNLTKPAPTILYLSGHGPVISNGVSYGNKVAYQHHGAWFARNGYVCLVLDTLQLGEIQGLHHGTHREGMWWWNSRGYTPAGVEAWNSLRALDYLQTRVEVDTNRFGATGRSGGGAYAWWIAALDDRIKAVAPVAGITDLQNHIVDGCVEGHCDCMFTVNTYGWDYPQVAALVAPRPLLIVNSDADSIFPLDGVQRTHAQVRRIYGLHQAANRLGLVIAPGPHKDTQDLQVPVFRWFNKHLKDEDPVIEMAALKFFTPQQLRVFATLPTNAINTNIHESFVPAAVAPMLPGSKAEWRKQREAWRVGLKEKSFAGWPKELPPPRLELKLSLTNHGLTLRAFDFDSQPGVRLRLYILATPELDQAKSAAIHVSDAESWREELAALRAGFGALSEEARPPDLEEPGVAATNFESLKQQVMSGTVLVYFPPRGIGLTAPGADARKQTQIRRRYMLLGQTLDGMRVWDIRRACQAVRTMPLTVSSRLELSGKNQMAVNVLYASLFEPGIEGLVLDSPPASHRAGPDYLNVLRVLDVPQAMAMAAERSTVKVITTKPDDWTFPSGVAQRLALGEGRLRVERP